MEGLSPEEVARDSLIKEAEIKKKMATIKGSEVWVPENLRISRPIPVSKMPKPNMKFVNKIIKSCEFNNNTMYLQKKK
ncbi:hypothetical protein MXB_5474 [Myxobolus squamalis]|nr:hypothetical protein MXB_5474 [Myxobolus squamalis]